MKTIKTVFCTCLGLALFVGWTSMHAHIEEAYEEGELVIEPRPKFQKPKIDLTIGENVVFEVPVYETNFAGNNAIIANATMTNSLEREVRATYSISFYDDQENMIGGFHGWLDLEPLSGSRLGSAIIYATPANVAKVTGYRLRTLVLEK